MKTWITDLRNTDLIIGRDWLKNMKSTIDWNKKIISFKDIQMKEISEWLTDLKKIFGELPDRQFSSRWSGMDHAIHLIQD